jgi:ankyrin repeat protein
VEPLLACCQGLIVVGDRSSTIRLVHYSLQEFFVLQEELFGRTKGQWHSALAATCLTFLFFPNANRCETKKARKESDGTKKHLRKHDDGGYYGRKDDGYANNHSAGFDNSSNYAACSGIWGNHSVTVFQYAALNWGHHFRQSKEMPGRAFALAQRYLRSSRAEIRASLSEIEHVLYYELYNVRAPSANEPFEVLGFFGLTRLGTDYWESNLNAAYVEGETALSIAARMGHEDLVALLIRKGAFIDMINSVSKGPIHHAIVGGHEGVVRMLIQAGARLNYDPGPPGDTPLRLAASCGQVDIVKLLIASGAAIDRVRQNSVSETALGCALDRGHVEVAKVLLEAGAAVDKGFYTPLCIAARHGNEELVQLLIDSGADLNRGSGHGKEETPLLAAASSGCERVVEILIEAGARVNQDVWNEILHVAADVGDRGVVELSIRHGADLNCARGSEDNGTVLHAAAAMNHAELVALLLERGVSPDPVDDKGDTPLFRALRGRGLEAARVLIKNGAEIERVNEYGLTPLISATLSGRLDAVRLLVEEGAVVDFSAEFSRDHDKDDRDYRDYSPKDSRALEGLTRLVYSSTIWVHGVRHERRNFINMLLHCDFFPNPSLATASRNWLEIFLNLVKKSGTFPRGLADIGRLRNVIVQSRAIPPVTGTEW